MRSVLPSHLIDIVLTAAGHAAPWQTAIEAVAREIGPQAAVVWDARSGAIRVTPASVTGTASAGALPAIVHVLQHAAALHVRLMALQHRAVMLAHALDRFPLAVFLIDRQMRLLAENASARRLSDQRDGIRCDGEILRFSRAQDVASVRQALEVTAREEGRVGVTVGRPSGALPYLGVLAPVASGAADCFMLGLSDPAADPEVDEQLLRRLYGLTRAESQVARLLLTGRTPEQAADELCVSMPTIRTHIKRLLLKTDTDRQGRLIGALLTGPACLVR